MLRRRQLHGIKFRRQHVVAGFIVDFYSPQAKVAIELDGAVHAQRLAYDETRDAILLSLGVRTLRIGNDDVMYNMNAVLVAIARVCNATHANSKRNTRARAKRTSISNSDKPTEP